MTEVWYAIGDFFYWIFKLMRAVHMGPNFLFMGLGGAFFLFWMWTQAKYNKEAKERGTLP